MKPKLLFGLTGERNTVTAFIDSVEGATKYYSRAETENCVFIHIDSWQAVRGLYFEAIFNLHGTHKHWSSKDLARLSMRIKS